MKINDNLRQAAGRGEEVELKELLLHPGGDALSTNEWGVTALMCAAAGGKSDCARLLRPASDVMSKDYRGRTALMRAASEGGSACVHVLLPVSNSSEKTNAGQATAGLARVDGHGHWLIL